MNINIGQFFVLLLFVAKPSDESHLRYPVNDEGELQLPLRGENCSLPKNWTGSWFQSGFHLPITINGTFINAKGQCVEADGDKFVLYNRKDQCFRCVAFHLKHNNVLQYKESFPKTVRESLKSMCSSIQGDFPLFTMFRLDGSSIPCPFSGPFTFSYDRGRGECTDPPSVMDTCLQSSRVLLNYQACPDVPGTESHAEELECLADWKEGSTRYLVGLMQYRHPSSYEERFRCFAYEPPGRYGMGSGRQQNASNNVIFRMAQSGDATCVGLSPTEGSRVLALKKDPLPKPCRFPDWLETHAQWESLDQRTRYIFDGSVLEISNFSQSAGSTLTRRTKCVQIVDNPSNQEKVTLIVHSTAECDMGYACLTIYRRNGHIIELQFGDLSRRREGACHSMLADPDATPIITLTSPSPESQQCPQFGLFDLTSVVGQNKSYPCISPTESTFASGCTSLDTFNMQTECSNPDFYLCHGWWEEANGEEFLVATSTHGWNSGQSQRFCFGFREILTEPLRELKSKKNVRNFEEYGDSDFDDSRQHLKKMLQFSRFSDTCKRHVSHGQQGELTFNVTHRDSCAQASVGSSGISVLTPSVISAVSHFTLFLASWEYILQDLSISL